MRTLTVSLQAVFSSFTRIVPYWARAHCRSRETDRADDLERFPGDGGEI